MSPETINAIKDAMIPVAEKIGQGAEYAWIVLVKGIFAEGITQLGIGSLLIIGALIIAYIVIKSAINFKFNFDEAFPIFLFGGIPAFIGLFIGLSIIYQ